VKKIILFLVKYNIKTIFFSSLFFIISCNANPLSTEEFLSNLSLAVALDAPLSSCYISRNYVLATAGENQNNTQNIKNFRCVNFTNKDLRNYDFTRANFTDAILDGAIVEGTNFAHAIGLTNEQKEYLRANGAINVPPSFYYELEDDQSCPVGHETTEENKAKLRFFRHLIQKLKSRLRRKKEISTQTEAIITSLSSPNQ
jgi:hypothetical protein